MKKLLAIASLFLGGFSAVAQLQGGGRGGTLFGQSGILTAPYTTLAASATNQFTLNVVYTNGVQRALLTGSYYMQPSTTLDAGGTIYYTNNNVGYMIQFSAMHNNPTPGLSMNSFCIPLSPYATFQFATNATAGTVTYVTNTISWLE